MTEGNDARRSGRGLLIYMVVAIAAAITYGCCLFTSTGCAASQHDITRTVPCMTQCVVQAQQCMGECLTPPPVQETPGHE